MVNEKAPRLDGFICEFYKELWDVVGFDLLYVHRETLSTRSLGDIINKGKIKLIPKSRNLELITNWMPITLLNVSYKIIAKALALRFRPLLPQIIHPKQTGFIQSQYILNNVIATWEGMEWACASQQNALFIKFFEKHMIKFSGILFLQCSSLLVLALVLLHQLKSLSPILKYLLHLMVTKLF